MSPIKAHHYSTPVHVLDDFMLKSTINTVLFYIYFKACNINDIKVSKGANIRNRYNQVPHLTQDTNAKVTNSQLYTTTRAKRSALSQQVYLLFEATNLHQTIAIIISTKRVNDLKCPFKIDSLDRKDPIDSLSRCK